MAAQFVFADPQLQAAVAQQAIGEAQLQAAIEQSRQAGMERMSRERQTRAVQQAEIDRQNRALEQQNQQFGLQQQLAREQMKSTEGIYAGQTAATLKDATTRESDILRRQTFAALNNLYSNKDELDPQTESEFRIATRNLPPEDVELLMPKWRNQREHRKAYAKAAGLAKSNWDSQLAKAKDPLSLEAVIKAFGTSRDKDYLDYDVTTGQFIPKYNMPREDALYGPQPAPAAAAGGFWDSLVRPGTAGQPRVRTIGEVLKAFPGTTGPTPESVLGDVVTGAINPFSESAISGLIRGVANPSIPAPVTPAVPPTPMQNIQRLLQSLGLVPTPAPVPPPAPRLLGNQGVLAPLEYRCPMPQIIDFGPPYGQVSYPDEATDDQIAADYRSLTGGRKGGPALEDYLNQIGGSVIRGAARQYAGLPKALGILGAEAARAELPGTEFPGTAQLAGVSPTADPTDPRNRLLYQAGELIERTARDITPAPAPELEKSFLATTVPEGVGSGLGFLTGGFVGKGVTGLLRRGVTSAATRAAERKLLEEAAKEGAPIALRAGAAISEGAEAAVLGATSSFTGAYEEALAKGADRDTALQAGLLHLPIGASEMVPLGNMIRRLDNFSGGTFSKYLITAGKETFEEALQEAAQTFASNAVAQGLYDPARSLVEGLVPRYGRGRYFRIPTQHVDPGSWWSTGTA